ncbi:MAG: WbqC family protein [Candidatus Omnitrophica bacterium]|nr:WbqC family protein [Candidatus Omnitrophota bacterium]
MIGIHQSQFLPWVPYFYKIAKSDPFVILDDVQFQKNGVQNRNKIKTPQQDKWITVPVSYDFGDPINKVRITDNFACVRLLKTIEMNYKKSVFFKDIFPSLEKIFLRERDTLYSLNSELLDFIMQKLGFETAIVYSSDLKLTAKKDELVIEIIKARHENEYLSGKGALGYMDLEKFKKEGISVYTYDFQYSRYPQLWGKESGFIPELSVIDLLFNGLDQAKDYILKNGSITKIT